MSDQFDPSDPRPTAPREPETGECCGSGCDPCVYDRYGEAMDRYDAALRAWEHRQAAKSVTT